MSRSHVLIVVVDGLRAAALGAYGNTVYPTPAFDRFAADSLLFDACFAPSADLTAVYRAMWQSRHPLQEATTKDGAQSLPQVAAEHGYATTLISDDAALLAIPAAADFQRHIAELETIDDSISTHTPSVYRVFGSACDVITKSSEADSPQLVWLHTQGLYGPWDAPLELQQSLLEEGDPPPVEESTPPDLMLADRDDSDTAFRYGCAYAAQVMLLDDCWDGLMAALSESDKKNNWLVMLIGARGFPLGEHQRVGGVDDRLYVEQLHVPLLMRFPDRRGRLSRRSQLVSHLGLLPTLAEWLGEPSQDARVESREPERRTPTAHLPLTCDGLSVMPVVNQANAKWRDALVSAGEHSRSVRTSNWSLRQDAHGGNQSTDASGVELYVRPDDRWEVNDVAVRCPEVVAELLQLAQETSERIRHGQTKPGESF